MAKKKFNIIPVLIVLIILFFSMWLSKGYNLPGQNVLSMALVLLVLSYQAHTLKMYYCRNTLLAILVFYLPRMSQYSEPGTYDPRSYLSLIVQVMIGWGIINMLGGLISWLT